MPIDTGVVGLALGPVRSELSVRQVMAYAAGVPDRNPRYFDDTRPEPVPAPPLFGVSLEWVLRVPLIEALRLGPEEARRVVHATHDVTLHRPARAGDTLTTLGRIVGVEARRPGAYVLVRYDTAAADGSPVITTYHGSIFRGVACTGPDRTLETAPPLASSEGRDGAGWTARIEIPVEAPHVYTECSGIWNPIHTERAYALASGLPDIVVHGTQTLALACRELVDREAGGDPARLARLTGRFAAMVLPGSAITVHRLGEMATAEGRAVFYRTDNAAGEPAIRDGVAVVRA